MYKQVEDLSVGSLRRITQWQYGSDAITGMCII